MIRPTCEDTFAVKKRNLGNHYYSLTFGPYSRVRECRPGHFVHVLLPETDIPFRRAFSIAAVSPGTKSLEIIFKACGRATRRLAGLKVGERVNILGPLGVSFTMPSKKETTVIVAGGIGFPPLYFLAARMVQEGHPPGAISFFYGGRTAADILERNRIKKLGVRFRPVTEDGSLGERGLVTEPVESLLVEKGSSRLRMYGCGPAAMLKAVDALGLKYAVKGQISVEAPMPCGIGVCLACVVPLAKGGQARVCCDGPVFNLGEVKL